MKNLTEVIENSKGRIFTVVFTKKDGSERVLNGRLGVAKYLAGGKKTTGEEYLTVYDLKSGGYRSVNKNTVKEVRFGGKVVK